MSIINPALDRDAIRGAFQRDGKVFIKDFLRPEVADRLYATLDGDLPWALHVSGRPDDFSHAELSRLSAEEARALIPRRPHSYTTGASLGAYNRLLIGKSAPDQEPPPESLQEYLGAINSAEYLEFMAFVTGVDGGFRISADASRYQAGHFLSAHTDMTAGESTRKLVAHVLGLTRTWEADWDGRLVFCDNWGRPLASEQPTFNNMVLFKVPQRHYVEAVSDDARGARYSLYGWLLPEDYSVA